MKIALINMDKYLTENDYGRLVMNIHDEAVCEVREEIAEIAAKGIQDIMAESLSYFLTKVKGGSSVKIKPYWEK